jgi:hypothetical protein
VTNTNTTHFCPSTAPPSSVSESDLDDEQGFVDNGGVITFTVVEVTEAIVMIKMLNIKLPK